MLRSPLRSSNVSSARMLSVVPRPTNKSGTGLLVITARSSLAQPPQHAVRKSVLVERGKAGHELVEPCIGLDEHDDHAVSKRLYDEVEQEG